MAIQKIKSGRVNFPDVDAFVGDNGVIFFDESQGQLRLGDGITPGGIPITVGGGGGGGSYVLPTASTTVKGGVKVDGTTITINNQIISVVNGVFTSGTYDNPAWINSLAYSKLTGTPTIPSNTNQLTNGAGFITSSALSGYATESYVTTRGYLTAVSWNDVTGKPTFATVATSGSYTDLTNKPTLFSGSYTDLTNKPTLFSGSYNDLTNKPIIPTDISQLSDSQGLLGQGGSGGTTYITNNVENPYTFSVAGDDSTLREISNGETLRFVGAGNISITTDTEGKVTITGPDLSSYATQSYVTSQGYITSSALTGLASESFVTSRGYLTSVSWNDLYDKPNLAGTYSFSVAADDSSLKEISAGESIKFIGSAGITTTSDAEGNITINGPDLSSYATQSYVGSQGFITASALTGYATESYVTSQGYITSAALTGYATESYVTTRGYLTTVDWNIVQNKPNFFSGSYNDLTDRPNLAGTYSWSIAADDSSQIEISSGNLVKIVGDRGVTTTSNADGQITITGPDLSSYATQSYVTSALNSAGVTVSETAPTGRTNGALWYSSVDLQMYVLYQNQWVAVSSGFSGNYNDLANRPSNVSQFANDAGYTTRDEVYAMILEMSS